MITFEILAEVFAKEKVKAFRVYDIGETLKKGLLMSGMPDFTEFIKSANIKRVFIYEYYEDVEDYYITEDVLSKEARYENEEFLEYILPQINEYNRQIANLDFNYPSWVAAICFCDNNAFFTICNNDRLLNGEELKEPEEKYKLICLLNEEHREKIREISENKIEVLREELREQILSDKSFQLCTNQQLRRDYAHKLFKNMHKKFEPLKKVMYRENLSILSLDGKDFIELLWREIKERNTK